MANSADPDHWLLQKPTVLDLHCLQRQGILGFSRTRVNILVLNIHVAQDIRHLSTEKY